MSFLCPVKSVQKARSYDLEPITSVARYFPVLYLCIDGGNILLTQRAGYSCKYCHKYRCFVALAIELTDGSIRMFFNQLADSQNLRIQQLAQQRLPEWRARAYSGDIKFATAAAMTQVDMIQSLFV